MTSLKEIQKHVFEGSYFWITGPTYESKIECQFLTQLGMDAVGMSTVPDFVAAAAIGMKTLGIAMITDVMDRTEPLSHKQVLENAEKAVPVLKVLLLEIVKKLSITPKIREAIDSHINYKGDIALIDEYPLVQPRQLLPPTKEQMKEAADVIRKSMSKLGIKEFDMSCLFLNGLKYAEAIQYYDSCFRVELGTLPHMPIFSASGKHGALAVGKLAGSGLNCLTICGLDTEGFNNYESYFVVGVLRELGITLNYTVIGSEWVLNGEAAVVPISGYFYRGFISSVDPSVQGNAGVKQRERISQIIRTLNPSLYQDATLFGFEGPLKPTPSELLTAATLKTGIYSVCSLYSW